MSMLNTRFKRWAQVIDARRSAGVCSPVLTRAHPCSILAIGCKDAVIARKVDSGLRHQGSEVGNGRSCASLRPRHTIHPVHKIQGFEDDMGRTIAVGCFELVVAKEYLVILK